jgi:ParB family chromosome partitioning protein
MKRKALGKGLRSLIPEPPPKAVATTSSERGGLQQIDLDRISPNRAQPRADFDDATLAELAASMKEQGVLQPVIVRPRDDGGFELIAGERRWRAAQMAGLLKIPAVVRESKDDELLELALVENLQRENLNPIEAASAYQTLIDGLGLTQEEVAARVGKQRSTITNALRLLNLPVQTQDRIRAGELSSGHAKALASLTNPKLQNELATRIVKQGLSVRQAEQLVAKVTRATPAKSKAVRVSVDPNVAAAQRKLESALGTKVRIVPGRKGGRLELHYFSDEELERIYQLILDATAS